MIDEKVNKIIYKRRIFAISKRVKMSCLLIVIAAAYRSLNTNLSKTNGML